MPVPSPVDCIGALLAGGRAERLGRARKGLLDVGGRRILDRISTELRAVTSDLVLVTNVPEAGEWLPGTRVVHDQRTGAGPLAGLEAALVAANGAGVLLVAWDMPFVDRWLLQCLMTRGAGRQAAAGQRLNGTVEPLCAFYASSALPVVRQRLDDRLFAMHDLLSVLDTAFISFGELSAAGDPEVMFLNVNDAADLTRVRAIADASLSRRGA